FLMWQILQSLPDENGYILPRPHAGKGPADIVPSENKRCSAYPASPLVYTRGKNSRSSRRPFVGSFAAAPASGQPIRDAVPRRRKGLPVEHRRQASLPEP